MDNYIKCLHQIDKANNIQLKNALKHALMIISSYELDINNSDWVGIDLAIKGFCQGAIYKEALQNIAEKLGCRIKYENIN